MRWRWRTTTSGPRAGVHPDNEGVHEPDVDDLLRAGRAAARGGHRRDRAGLLPAQRPQRGRHGMAARALPRAHPRRARQWAAAGGPHPQRQSATRWPSCASEGAGRRAAASSTASPKPQEVARAALDLGFHISFSGILTFKNAEELRDVARCVPLERCLIETDSPYLAPVPLPRQDQPAGLCAACGRPAGRS